MMKNYQSPAMETIVFETNVFVVTSDGDNVEEFGSFSDGNSNSVSLDS